MPSLLEMVEQDATPATPEPVETTPDDPTPEPAEGAEGETAEADPAPEGGDGPEPSTPKETAPATEVLARAKELLGEEAHAWLDTLKEDDALLRSAWEATKLVGKRNADGEQAANVVRYLSEHGVTGEDLVAYIESRKTPKGADIKQSDNGLLDPSWYTLDKDGHIVPTSNAPPDFEARAAKAQVRAFEMMLNPTKLLEHIQPLLGKDIEAKTAAAKQEMADRIAQQERERSFNDWVASKRALLFVGESQQLTPLGAKAQEYLESGKINPSLPWIEQSELALRMAAADLQPKTPITKPVPGKAKHQTTPAPGTTKKLSPQEYFARYGTDLDKWVEYDMYGVLPTE